MSRNKPKETLSYLTDQTFLYYDEKSNHIIISTEENADHIPFEGKAFETETWYPYQDMPKHSLNFIFSTNGNGFNEEQQDIIVDVKELLLGNSTLHKAPVLISEKYLFTIIDGFQASLTTEQVNALLTTNTNPKSI